jgi:lipoyl(octanoyl) transferase
MRELVSRQLGLLPYDAAWKLQAELVEARQENRIPDTLLFVEHPPVITLGRKTPGVRENEGALPREVGGVPVHIIERGGEATFHGPGQLIVYPILELNIRFGPKAFLRLMEEAMIAVLEAYGVQSRWVEGKTGVWLEDREGRERKIASLGIAVRRNVSYHGLALNVNTDLSYFRLIQPCGFAPTVMTSLKEQLGREISLLEAGSRLEAELRERLSKSLGRPALAV